MSVAAPQVHKPLAPLPCGAPDPVADFLRAEVRRSAALQAAVQASLQHALAALHGRAALTRGLHAVLHSLTTAQVRTTASFLRLYRLRSCTCVSYGGAL